MKVRESYKHTGRRAERQTAKQPETDRQKERDWRNCISCCRLTSEIVCQVLSQFHMLARPTLSQTFHEYLQSVETIAIVAPTLLTHKLDEAFASLMRMFSAVPDLVSFSSGQERSGLDERLEQLQINPLEL